MPFQTGKILADQLTQKTSFDIVLFIFPLGTKFGTINSDFKVTSDIKALNTSDFVEHLSSNRENEEKEKNERRLRRRTHTQRGGGEALIFVHVKTLFVLFDADWLSRSVIASRFLPFSEFWVSRQQDVKESE